MSVAKHLAAHEVGRSLPKPAAANCRVNTAGKLLVMQPMWNSVSEQIGRASCDALEHETGQAIGFRQTVSLAFAATEAGLRTDMRRGASMARCFGLQVDVRGRC